jgi:peptidoglycan lytic transglycosylase
MHATAPTEALARDLTPATFADQSLAAEPPERQPTALHVAARQLNVLEGHRARITGRLLEDGHPGSPDLMVVLQRRAGRRWLTVARSHTRGGGRFALNYVAHTPRSEVVRVRFPGDDLASSSTRRVGHLNVFRAVNASWYGGGGSLACGGELTGSTLGVANRTLPCGTLVAIYYHGQTLIVPVIDRGPYANGADWDLTMATGKALGMDGTATVGAVSLPRSG